MAHKWPGAVLAAMIAASTVVPVRADALIDELLAQSARATPQAFKRTTRIERPDKPPVKRVDRHDPAAPEGRQWTLLTVDGRQPTPADAQDYRKEVERQAVPGFHRLHILLAGTPVRQIRDGVTLYHWPKLQPGALGLKGPDISPHLSADARVDAVDGKLMITAVRVYAAKPFSVMVIARIKKLETLNIYTRLPDGFTTLAEQTTITDTNIPFRPSGIMRTHTYFEPR